MKLILFLLTLLFTLHFFAQTPMIMHKRMGGTTESFIANLQNPHAPIRQSNFGLPPTIHVKRAVIDSVIVVNDSSVLVVTSHQIVEEFGFGTDIYYDSLESNFVCTDSMLQKSLVFDSTGTWKPGRDLMVNHAVFNPNSSCEKILHTLRWEYALTHSTRDVVFIGFDCSQPEQKGKKKKGSWVWFDLPWPKNPNSLMLIALIVSSIYLVFMQFKTRYVVKTA